MDHGSKACLRACGSTHRQAGDPLLKVRGLCKYFPIFSKGFFTRQTGTVKAVDGVSFDIARGETLGLVGESGCGKTTVARTILRALEPTGGSVLFRVDGETVDLASLPQKALKPLRAKMQMIFQDPFSSLNPRMTVGDIVGEPLLVNHLLSARGRLPVRRQTGRRDELEGRVAETLRKVGLGPEHMNRYPHAFSGGQRQRIGIARALVMRPSFVVADEAVSALDVSVQAQVVNLLADLQEEFCLTYIFVAHDLSVVRHISDTVAVMYAGRIVELARTEAVFEGPEHPYTKALMSAVPQPDPDRKMDFDLAGEVADPAMLPPGCSFHPRCPRAFGPCDRDVPDITEVCPGRFVACHLFAGKGTGAEAGACGGS